tara:strand:- start:26344 stop:26916 length:573 start_codon:yes stop_codon:yes gene_type:complete
MSDAIKALCKAQKEMGAVVKNAKNPHLKSKYADLGSVMEACFDALHANGFAVMQPGGQDDFGPFVETVFAHETGELFRSKVYLVISKNDMQGVGSAWTYARRYGLLGMAGLAPEDDDGEATKRPRNDAPPPFDAKAVYDRIKLAIEGADSTANLDSLWANTKLKAALAQLSGDVQAELQTAYSNRMGELL